MKFNITLEVDGSTYSAELDEDDGDAKYTVSHIWVCTGCGSTFGKLTVETWAKVRRPYQPLAGRCRACPPHFGFIPGSLWLSWDRALQRAFPAPVLHREVLLHIEHLERKENDC